MYTDPISDMLTRIRNAFKARKDEVNIPFSKNKEKILKILHAHGFIKDVKYIMDENHGISKVFLKYGPKRKSLILGLKRISKPGLRVYIRSKNIKQVYGGRGIVIMSTSKGIITGADAKKQSLGGEVICHVW